MEEIIKEIKKFEILNEKQIKYLLKLKNSDNEMDNWVFKKFSEGLKNKDFNKMINTFGIGGLK